MNPQASQRLCFHRQRGVRRGRFQGVERGGIVFDLTPKRRGFEGEAHGDRAGGAGVAAVRNDIGEMFLERQVQTGNTPRGEVVSDGQFVQRVVDERDFRSLAVER